MYANKPNQVGFFYHNVIEFEVWVTYKDTVCSASSVGGPHDGSEHGTLGGYHGNTLPCTVPGSWHGTYNYQIWENSIKSNIDYMYNLIKPMKPFLTPGEMGVPPVLEHQCFYPLLVYIHSAFPLKKKTFQF